MLDAGRHLSIAEHLNPVSEGYTFQGAHAEKVTVYAVVVQIEERGARLKASKSRCIEVHVGFHLP